ncbi:MiaB-like tRNA modifying enzyme [Coccomyxa subellipsoidea C-169]|uniref:MiaB-like tRNA modifying enzyme n=1 Tax=Coccomyxa subellipsoidea (strain C-169) TaxID=574566 RepID=I0Z0V8_COCSC|nr:MiaB-like tRNA modifying enzyme [Coccomyxa subellipsoidea C-169]EIE24277.1 MiaB-like tRNA modifying enzyme [Coccomyxa subellipsoidea C-169]|eukprot:XP_005648821.1 MiaB-like tRNA modifying enzyme [Coccomyxa subellipsoidea C-169]
MLGMSKMMKSSLVATTQLPHIDRRVPARTARRCQARAAPAVASEADALKVSFVSLGCPKNVVDGEVLLGDLARNGFTVTEDRLEADCIVVNTCAFVEDAKAESLEAIMEASELKKDGQVQKVIVTGCLAQRYSTELAESLPEADYVVGFQNYSSLPATLRNALQPTANAGGLAEARVQVGESTVAFRPEADRYRLTPQHTAYLRVAEGCNHSCTFCAIPGFRGKFRSKPWQHVLDEARQLVASGVKELNLIAEDTNQYGMDRKDGNSLAELMAELGKLEGLHWMRILYAYPSYFSDALIDEIASNPKASTPAICLLLVCKYIDIPLQHISNMTLLGMNRPPQLHTVSLLHKLRERIPELALRTTFISGFPGETEDQHQELLQFCRDFKFERMGAFAYSEEDGTPAAAFSEQVPEEIRQARRDSLISQQQDISQTFAESLVGREVDVLVEGWNEDDCLVGRTQWDAPDVDPIVFLTPTSDARIPPLEAGQMRRCLITGTSLFDLEAQPIL